VSFHFFGGLGILDGKLGPHRDAFGQDNHCAAGTDRMRKSVQRSCFSRECERSPAIFRQGRVCCSGGALSAVCGRATAAPPLHIVGRSDGWRRRSNFCGWRQSSIPQNSMSGRDKLNAVFPALGLLITFPDDDGGVAGLRCRIHERQALLRVRVFPSGRRGSRKD